MTAIFAISALAGQAQEKQFSIIPVLTPEEHAAIDALDGPTRAGHDPMTFTYA